MPIEYRQGDVLEALKHGDIGIVAHGVNCSGGFGSGIAGQIAKQYPRVRQMYMKKYEKDKWLLGDIQYVAADIVDNKVVINCATQQTYGRNPRNQPNGRYCDYEAIRRVMARLNVLLKGIDIKLAMPYIGCGLAGGDWLEVETIINEEIKDNTVYVYRL